MPIYEYRCKKGHTFDVMQSFNDDAIDTCEVCGAPCSRVFRAPAVHFKGSGFYNTDYGTKKRSREMKEQRRASARASPPIGLQDLVGFEELLLDSSSDSEVRKLLGLRAPRPRTPSRTKPGVKFRPPQALTGEWPNKVRHRVRRSAIGRPAARLRHSRPAAGARTVARAISRRFRSAQADPGPRRRLRGRTRGPDADRARQRRRPGLRTGQLPSATTRPPPSGDLARMAAVAPRSASPSRRTRPENPHPS